MQNESFFIDDIHVLSYRQSAPQNNAFLFVHGAWHGSWCWNEYFLPYFFKKGYSCYAIDLRSHGKSKPRGIMNLISLADYEKDVQNVIESLPEEKISLIGHSMGGLVVLQLLQKNLPKTASAVLLAPATPGGVLASTIYTMIHHPIAYLQASFSYRLFFIVKYFKVFKEIFFHSETNDSKIKNFHKKMQNESFRAYMNMIFARIRFNRIQTRIMILAAENDRVFPLKHMRNLAQKLQCDLKILANTGHDIMLENDWQKAAESIEQFNA